MAQCAAPTVNLETILLFRRGRILAGRGAAFGRLPHLSRFACHLPLKGKACGRPHGAAPTVNLETVPLFRRGRTLAGPQIYAARPGGRALQPCTSRHLLGKARRESGTAPAANFADPGPSGPEGGGGRLIAAPTAIPTRLRWFGNPGAEAEPHQRQFLQTQGPMARREGVRAADSRPYGVFMFP